MKNNDAQRVIAVLNGWLSAHRSEDGLTGTSRIFYQGYLEAIEKVKQIITEEYERE